MVFAPALTTALCCPRCPEGALESAAGALLCVRCGRRYPTIGNIPCLMGDPPLWRSLWLSRLLEFLSVTEQNLAGWHAEASLPGLLPRTRARLARTIAAVEDQRTRVEALCADFKEGAPQAIPARPEGGDVPALMTCYENLFRDWVWGDKETEATRALVARVVREPLGRLAVFGAGAGRLAVDIHQTLRPAETLALDVNPLPLLVAERLVRGETVDLPEFPVAPHSDDQVVILRRLHWPGPLREGFAFVFADALRPPFPPESLDTVVTSWFIDAARADVRQTAAIINGALRPGGHWINLGPLRFKETISRSYTIEEVWEIVAQSAFELGAREREDIPYFDSPVSGSRRLETVFCFTARKTGEASPIVVPDAVAPWIADASVPIPRTPTVMNLGRTSLFTAGAMSLIDGVRSMSDVANEIGKSTGIAPAKLLDQLRAFFAKLPPG
jgi:uncharacterized protein YbaR (Trm112 family)